MFRLWLANSAGAKIYKHRESGEVWQTESLDLALKARWNEARTGTLYRLEQCPKHGGAYDCTPFCEICQGNQESETRARETA